MIWQILFIIVSLSCGGLFWWYALPALQKSGNFIFKFLILPYPYIKQYLPYPDYSYFILLSLACALIVWIICQIIYFSQQEKLLTSHGSASWANEKDIKDLKTKKGVPVGRFGNNILHVNTHLVTCAGTRSGKGIGGIIPTLLEYPDSIICLDVKGENCAVTAKQRKNFGKVFAINPFNFLNIPTSSFNWLDTIDLKNENCISQAQIIATSLVGKTPGNSVENHFNDQAARLIQGVILFVCNDHPESRNMVTVSDLIHTMNIQELCKAMTADQNLAYGFVYKVGSQFLNNENQKETGSILSTAQRALNFIDTPEIQRTLVKSDFKISELPDQIITVYLIMPQERISENQGYIRVFFDLAISSITSRQKRGRYEVLFLLDEASQLGYMEIIPKAISLIRGLGGQIWLFFQDFPQMKKNYGDEANSILNNSTQIYYGCNDPETAEKISKRLGKKTQKIYDDKGNYSLYGRSLLTPDEVCKMPSDKPIIFMTSQKPIMVKRLNYLKDIEYKDLFNYNPYFK